MSTWNVEIQWKWDGTQFLGLNNPHSYVWKQLSSFQTNVNVNPQNYTNLIPQ